MLAQSSCTLYKCTKTGYDRFYIPFCHWQENRTSNVLKNGLQTNDGIIVYIPADSLVLSPAEGLYPANTLFPDMDISPANPTKDMLVKGDCRFVFNNSTVSTVSDSMKEFKKLYPQFVTVMSIDRKLYGSKRLQHIKVYAK